MCFDPVTAIAGISAAVSSMGTTLGTIGTIASIGGGAISAYAQMQNSKAEAAAATRTAAAQDEAARKSIEQGEQESDRQRRVGAQLQSENKAAMAANGVDVTGAQALDVLDDQRFMVEADAFTIRENARSSAGNLSQAAANSRASASSAKSNAFFAPVGTLLSTAAKVGDKYKSWVPNAQGAY